ncbi:MAG: GAF domain-containing sensor histidine kinase [Deltaproteobacteria bacterium]|nr:GAF domain-containing sensor histidine kinase [Deltaproteobacteria bacterium]
MTEPKLQKTSAAGEERKLLHDRIAAMQQIGRSLSSTLDIDELLDRIMKAVTSLMNAGRSTLFLADRVKKEIWSKVIQGTEVKDIRLAFGQGIAGWVAESKKLVRIDDAYADDRFDPSVDKRSGFRTHSILCAPIFDSRRHLLGVIQVLNKIGGPFDGSDEEMLSALSSQIAIALENSNLYRLLEKKAQALERAKQEAEQSNRELDLLYQIERELTKEGHVDQVLDKLIALAMDAMHAEAGSVLLVDESKGDLYFKTALGEKGEDVKKLRLKAGEGIVGHVAQTGEAALVHDPKRDKRHHRALAKKLKFSAHAIACAPLIADGEVIGALELLNKYELVKKKERKPLNFNDDDLKLLTLLAAQAARIITDAKRRAAAAQEERLQTIGQALSGVIHDFRSPMTVIAGYTELIAREDDHERRASMAQAVSSQVEHMNAMVGELLAFSRGETAIYKRKVYLNKFAQEIEALFSVDTTQSKAELSVLCFCNEVAHFDPVKIKRVLTNLVRNALEACEPGQGKVALTIGAQGQDLVFTVKDNGKGIADEISTRLFDSFVTSGKKNGTGLGLTVCKRFVEDHGGQIGYQSNSTSGGRSRGTTFTFTLPKALVS